MNKLRILATVSLACCAIFTASCSSVYYSMWEKLGKEKHDLLRDNIQAVSSDQHEVAEELKNALERLQEAYGSGGGDIEKMYNALKRDYERSESDAATLRKRITKVETIAGDLFEEWNDEIGTMKNATFRAQSTQRLQSTKERFNQMRDAMHRAEKGIDPVLSDLRDHMLVLKHSLNAQAVARLGSTEVAEIEKGISKLLTDMNESIRKSDEFLGSLAES